MLQFKQSPLDFEVYLYQSHKTLKRIFKKKNEILGNFRLIANAAGVCLI